MTSYSQISNTQLKHDETSIFQLIRKYMYISLNIDTDRFLLPDNLYNTRLIITLEIQIELPITFRWVEIVI